MNDFEFGWFLHLVTDYLFFWECFTTDYLLSKSYDDFCKELYYDYYADNQYLEDKYNLTRECYKAYPESYYPGIPYEKSILSMKMVDNFIERVVNIDIDKYILKIKENKKNIKP